MITFSGLLSTILRPKKKAGLQDYPDFRWFTVKITLSVIYIVKDVQNGIQKKSLNFCYFLYF